MLASSCAMLRCSVSWVSSIKKGKANVQEVPALASSLSLSLLHPSIHPRPALFSTHTERSPRGRADHSGRLRGIDERVRGGSSSSSLILHTDWSRARDRRGKTRIHRQTETTRKKYDWVTFNLRVLQWHTFIAEGQIDHTRSRKLIHECAKCHCQ